MGPADPFFFEPYTSEPRSLKLEPVEAQSVKAMKEAARVLLYFPSSYFFSTSAFACSPGARSSFTRPTLGTNQRLTR